MHGLESEVDFQGQITLSNHENFADVSEPNRSGKQNGKDTGPIPYNQQIENW